VIYTVRIERTVYTILHVEATGVAHAMARAEMKCPATGSAWQVRSETCKVIGGSEDGKALSENERSDYED
jgi:hypothetical protein